jgi:hypothetical protein
VLGVIFIGPSELLAFKFTVGGFEGGVGVGAPATVIAELSVQECPSLILTLIPTVEVPAARAVTV